MEDSITPVLVAGPFVSMDRVTFTVANASTIDARVAWASGTADLDVLLIRPANACDVAIPECLLGEDGPVDGARCPFDEDEVGNVDLEFGPTASAVSTAARRSGTHEVWILATLAVPGIPVAYSLEIAVDGFAPVDLAGPFETTAIVGSPHCKEWWAAQRAIGAAPGPIVGGNV